MDHASLETKRDHDCRNKIFYNVEREKVEELFLRWRGSSVYFRIADIDEMSHKLIHIYTNLLFADEEVVKNKNKIDLNTNIMLNQDGKELYTKEIIRFVFNYVKKEVTEKLEEYIKNKLYTKTNLSLKAGINNSLLGISFEQIAHQMLRDEKISNLVL
ncbi:hypothetical protein C1645_814504 [Glomus cerebriforme]|uniref:Uncharacterized protein n=1 Tax=Glomus cerebriforme TaxID=658196 RepID=A0A397TKT9_9GLOM|nr:hypothetical protein C1645_814504 [Glomus cerebriforme]